METNIMDIKIRAALDGHQFDVIVADKDNGKEFIYGFGFMGDFVATQELVDGIVASDNCIERLEALKEIEKCCDDEELYEITMVIPDNDLMYA